MMSTDAPSPQLRCPACYGLRQSGVLGRHERWSLLQCLDCGLQHFWPAENPGREWYETNEMYQVRDLVLADWLGWYHRAALEHLPVRNGRLIDVGCGIGAFVAAARHAGFHAVGVDFSQTAVAAGRTHFGLNELYCGTLEQFRSEHRLSSFDIVTAFEVLEHMDDSRRFLLQLRELLVPGGYLALSVPNRERFPRLLNEGDLPPHHFTRWNADVMRGFLERNRFTVHKIVICPPDVTIKAFLLHHVRFNLVMRLLRKAREGPVQAPRTEIVARARSLAFLKERLAAGVAKVLAPIASPFVRGPMLVAIARRTEA